MSNLLRVAPAAAGIMPASMSTAMLLATRIIRSELHCDTFACLYKMRGAPGDVHVKRDHLEDLINKDGVFVIDKLRHMPEIRLRSAVNCSFDPFRIYVNPLMLLEMIDREREASMFETLDIDEEANWPDLLKKLTPQEIDLSIVNFGEDFRPFNSIMHARQLQRHKKEEMAKLDECEQTEPATKKSKVNSFASPPELIIPSTMTTYQKHVIMLTILLVHEVDNLLMFLLSSCMRDHGGAGGTPAKKFSKHDRTHFTDAGHLMERTLYGFCIDHAYNADAAQPLAIDEILGSLEQYSAPKFILQPSDAFLEMVGAPGSPNLNEVITSELLQFDSTSGAEYVQPSIGTITLTRDAAVAWTELPGPAEKAQGSNGRPEWLANAACFKGTR